MSVASPEDQPSTPAEGKAAEEDGGGEAAEEQSEVEVRQHPEKLVRVSWAFQVIQANKEGDVDKLKQAFRIGKGALIDTQTARGGYGGFRYSAWGKAFGGQPDGETILHLVVRPDNSQYPYRWEMANAVLDLEPDFTVRNAAGKIPRDLNRNMCDALLPVSQWRNKHVLAWLESAGRALRCKAQWITLFEMKEIVGFRLLEMASQGAFDRWLVPQLSDLTKLGVASEALDRETYILKKILREVAQDEEAGQKYKAKQERRIRKAAQAKAEARAKAEVEAKAAAEAEAEAKAQASEDTADTGGGGGGGEDGETRAEQADGPKLPPVASAAAPAGAGEDQKEAETEPEATEDKATKLPVLAPSAAES